MVAPTIPFAPDSQVVLTYPESTLVEANTQFRKRRIQIKSVRDLTTDPLTPEEYLRRPLTQRSRYLLTAYDLDRRVWRQFYVGCSLEHASEIKLAIASIPAHSRHAPKIISRPYDATRRDRILLARHLKDVMANADDDTLIRVIPVTGQDQKNS